MISLTRDIARFLKARKISAFFKIERSTRDKGFPSLDVFSRFDRPFHLMFRVCIASWFARLMVHPC